MNIFQKLAAWTARKSAGYAGISFSTQDHHAGKYLGSGQETYTGRNVTEPTAMGITALFACIRLLAETMGSMPSAFYRRSKGGNLEKMDDYPLAETLIYTPNSDMNGIAYRECRTANLALHGNSYSIIERRSNGDVLSLYPIPSIQAQVKKDSSTDWQSRYGFPDRGKIEWYPPEKVWHPRLFSFGGLVGLSPLANERQAFGVALAAEEFNARLFGQGLMPSARVSIPAWLTDEQRKVANEKLLAMQTGLTNMAKPMLLEGGMTVESGLFTPADAQFLQLRQFTILEICRIFRIPPHMIAALERATDNNIEKLGLEFVMYTMMSYISKDEQYAYQLLKPADRANVVLKYNVNGLLRADSVARAQLYSILLQNGVLSRNEVRALEDRNSSDDVGMDDHTVQLNMTLIQLLEKMTAGKQEAAPTVDATQPTKSGDTHNLNLSLPDSIKTELAHRIEVPGVLAMAKAVEASNENNTSALELFRRDLGDMTKAVKDNSALLEKSIATTLMPNEAVKDAAGEIIGSKKVERLKLVK